MADNDNQTDNSSSGPPLFVVCCAIGFLIIAACGAYFITRFFL